VKRRILLNVDRNKEQIAEAHDVSADLPHSHTTTSVPRVGTQMGFWLRQRQQQRRESSHHTAVPITFQLHQWDGKEATDNGDSPPKARTRHEGLTTVAAGGRWGPSTNRKPNRQLGIRVWCVRSLLRGRLGRRMNVRNGECICMRECRRRLCDVRLSGRHDHGLLSMQWP